MLLVAFFFLGAIVFLKVPLYLLLVRQSFVKDYLDVFLREAQRLQQNPRDIKEVCFLCIQCMEVRIPDYNFSLGDINNFSNDS